MFHISDIDKAKYDHCIRQSEHPEYMLLVGILIVSQTAGMCSWKEIMTAVMPLAQKNQIWNYLCLYAIMGATIGAVFVTEN